MVERYFVQCACGEQLRVELFEAGTSKICGACRSPVSIPGSTKLKELSGDKYPFLRPIEKIQRTAALHEPPFDGRCHACMEADADFQVPITLNAMVERAVRDEGGIRPTITGGVALVAGATDELWCSTKFPLLLCAQCHAQYLTSSQRARVKRIVKGVALIVCFLAFLYVAISYMEVVAALSGLFCLIGAIAWVCIQRNGKKLDPYILYWLSHIRWVSEAIAAEDECDISVGGSQPIESRAGK